MAKNYKNRSSRNLKEIIPHSPLLHVLIDLADQTFGGCSVAKSLSNSWENVSFFYLKVIQQAMITFLMTAYSWKLGDALLFVIWKGRQYFPSIYAHQILRLWNCLRTHSLWLSADFMNLHNHFHDIPVWLVLGSAGHWNGSAAKHILLLPYLLFIQGHKTKFWPLCLNILYGSLPKIHSCSS